MRFVQTRAPGRVNLIGEHTDYNGGLVMPCAIAYDTQVRAEERNDDAVIVNALLGDARTEKYVNGVLSELRSAGVPMPGMNLQIDGSLPLGAGLSSSASLEIAVALAALAMADVQFDRYELAALAQRAEIEYVGTRCGIMDQFAVLFARRGCAMFLDTRSLEFELIEVPASVSVIICNTMVKHELVTSEYNVRRRECEASVAMLQKEFPDITQLRDVTLEQLEGARYSLGTNLYRRATHVATENERVFRARDALRRQDVLTFGGLMNASHESLRAFYEVSCAELDMMVALARELPGVYGARMTGGGFGGCTVNLVEASHADEFRTRISDAYLHETGIVPELYDGTPADGAQVLNA